MSETPNDGAGQHEDQDESTRVERAVMRGVERVAGVTDEIVHHRGPNGARALVNAFFGDRLDVAGSALSHTMGVRRRGRSVPLTREGLAAAYPEATGEVVVLVHGLLVTETFWQQGRFGNRLHEDLGLTPVTVRYNTGLRISHNGHDLDRILAALVAHWPVPVTRLVLVGHSMGGLVVHSALAQADVTGPGAEWVSRVSDTVTLGSPHLGAPLERGANHAARALGTLRHVRPLADLLRSRSVGIQDLRHGNILDEEWDGVDPADRRGRRVDVPLHPGIRHLAIVGLLGKKVDSRVAQLFGDGIVTAASARGSGRRSPEHRRFPAEDVVVLPGVSHLALVRDETVYAAIRERLGARVDP
ncbi:lipase family alpha/beta hydrolase [Knoellia sp. LjRoot47]|uniref:lipase family alpha/beta hydrolase n=1 Tax=Knoellia sp. LjRoot47 TaxID=3342330 RepID=UPI003ED096A7